MFNIYETRKDRDELLDKLKKLDPCVALVIAFLDFEWTVRRCILALGKSPTKDINAKFAGELPIKFFREGKRVEQIEKARGNGKFICGLEGYKELWTKEVLPVRKISLFDLLKSKVKVEKIPEFDLEKLKLLNVNESVLKNTDAFLKFVFKRFRNTLIHGVRSKVEEDTAKFVFNFMVACSRALCAYADEQGKSIYGKKIIRKTTAKE